MGRNGCRWVCTSRGNGDNSSVRSIKEKFAEKKTSAVEECSQRLKCGEFRAEILEKYSKLGKELRKYDPADDAIGGRTHKYGITKPCGHYIEISNLQGGLKRDLKKFQQECADTGLKLDRNVDRMANQTIERPPGC